MATERPFLFRATQGGDKVRLPNGEVKTIDHYSFSPEGPAATDITVHFKGGDTIDYSIPEFDATEVTLIEGNPVDEFAYNYALERLETMPNPGIVEQSEPGRRAIATHFATTAYNPNDEDYPAQWEAYYDSVKGNPGEQPLMVTLDELAQFVEYEAKVVEVAAGNIDDAGIQHEAEQQAEAMEEAAESLHEASEEAADTAAEIYNETGIPSNEQGTEVVAGNPSVDSSLVDRLAEVHYREELELMALQAEQGVLYPGAGKDFQESWAETYRQAASKAIPEPTVTRTETDMGGTILEMGNPAAEQLPNAPHARQDAGQSLQQGTGEPGQHSLQSQSIVGVGNPITQGITPSNRVGLSTRAAGGARNALVGNPGDPGESVHHLAAERSRIEALNWNDEGQKQAVIDALNEAIRQLEGADEFGYVVAGNPDVPEALEEAAENVAEAETVTEDEPPAIEHWYFRTRNVGKKLKIG